MTGQILGVSLFAHLDSLSDKDLRKMMSKIEYILYEMRREDPLATGEDIKLHINKGRYCLPYVKGVIEDLFVIRGLETRVTWQKHGF